MSAVISGMSGLITSVIKGLAGVFFSTIGAAEPPYGLLWKYLYFCIISSLFLSIFMFGGIVTPFIGILYIYFLLYKRIKCFYNKGKQNQPPECL